MNMIYYTYRIVITNRNKVKAISYDSEGNPLGEPDGEFRLRDEALQYILKATQREVDNFDCNIKELGSKLFGVLFDEKLRHDFFNVYRQSRNKGAMLRVELDVDEQELPDVAALPWEFMHVPSEARYGELWLATAPDIIFSRRRAHWKAPDPIYVAPDECLRIALAVSAPPQLGPVKYDRVWQGLNTLAGKMKNEIELLELVNPATPKTIDDVLEQRPHIFHFIGHAQFRTELRQDAGQIALVDGALDKAMWIEAERFSEFFRRHQPGIVVLQACEGAVLSKAEAFVGVASKIVDQDIPVVIAMQYKISNNIACRFVLEFYRRLFEHDPVDKAAQEGRRHISLGPTGYDTRDFATPVLFCRTTNGHVFQRFAPSQQLHGRSVEEGLIALIELMQSPEVRDCVIRFQADFKAARKQIDVLDFNKRLHDLLHTIQFQIYNLIAQQAKRPNLDDKDWEILMNYELTFRPILEELKDISNQGSVVLGEILWIQDLIMAGDELYEAVEDLNVERLRKAVWLIKRVLSLQPCLINARLSSGARALRLADLLGAMEVVRSKTTHPDVDKEKVRQLETGINNLAKLQKTLELLIKTHDRWQIVDNDMRRIEALLTQSTSELEISWPDLNEKIESLCRDQTETWAQSLKAESDKLNTNIKTQDKGKIKQSFRRYRRLASDQFYRVDLALKNLCQDLRRVGDPLSSVLRIIGE